MKRRVFAFEIGGDVYAYSDGRADSGKLTVHAVVMDPETGAVDEGGRYRFTIDGTSAAGRLALRALRDAVQAQAPTALAERMAL